MKKFGRDFSFFLTNIKQLDEIELFKNLKSTFMKLFWHLDINKE